MGTLGDKPAGVRPKQFRYSTSVNWSGERTGILGSKNRDSIRVSSPPEFKGVGGFWTPEDMFVGALEMCQLLTFLALAQRGALAVLSYRSTAEGTLEFIDGSFRFTKVLIRPEIVVAEPADVSAVASVVEQAHRQCLVAKSVTAEVVVDPQITIENTQEAPAVR